jgi:hypothetical protein
MPGDTMPSTATAPSQPDAINRAAINRANSQHSTGPRTEAGKQRSALNALTHGLTCRTAVLPSEDPAAYQQRRSQFLEEYRPATPTETQLVHELADTAWRLNRIPLIEADLLSRAQSPAPSPQSPAPAVAALATLGLHGHRLSRQFHKTLEHLREIQLERRERERRELKDAAAIVQFHKHKGLPYDPAQDGFVFSKEVIQAFVQRTTHLNQATRVERFLFEEPANSPKPNGQPTN